MPRMKCCLCKNCVSELQQCCHRYICDPCHRQHCKVYAERLQVEGLKGLVLKLHASLNAVIAGETLDPLDKEDLDTDVFVYTSVGR